MSEGPTPEAALPPEAQVISPTETSNAWRVNYKPSLKQVLAGTAGLAILAIGWSQGHTDMETAMAMEQGLFSEALLKGMLGVAEVVAGVAGGVAGGVWAKRDSDKQLALNPKPK